MEKFFGVAQDLNGDVLPGATVTVTITSSGATATIYEDDESTPKSNPGTADGSGRFEFKAANSEYDVKFKLGSYSYTLTSLVLNDGFSEVSVADINDPSAELNLLAGSSQGSVMIAYNGDTRRVYSWEPTPDSAENVPITVDGASSGQWIQVAVSDGVSTSQTFANDGLHILDTDASHDLIVSPGSNLTADRVFTLTTGDAARTLDISAADVTVSAYGATLVDDADAATARGTLGLGTIATQAASAVAITGGTIDGTVIGGTTAAAITGTTIRAETSFTLEAVGSQTVVFNNASDDLVIQGGSTGTNFIAEVTAQDNDGTDSVYYQVDAIGTGAVSTLEALQAGWDATNTEFSLHTSIGASGTDRSINIYTEGNRGQVVLGTTGVTTISSLVATTADINAGTIDGTLIGGTTPAAISGTTGTFSGNLTLSAGNIKTGNFTIDGTVATSVAEFVSGNATLSGMRFRDSGNNVLGDLLWSSNSLSVRSSTSATMSTLTTSAFTLSAGISQTITSGNLTLSAGNVALTSGSLTVAGTTRIASTGIYHLPSYTVAGIPAAGTAGRAAYVSNGDAGSPCLAIDNGTNWLRVTLGATISAT